MTGQRGDRRRQRTAAGAPARVAAGRVGRPHGLDGSFYVTGARSRLLALGACVAVGARSATIVRRAGTEQRPIVRLEGVEDRAGAEALRGVELSVAAEQAPALGADEWWEHELKGCAVWAGEVCLGSVIGLLELPSCEALEVRAQEGETLLVPMVKAAIRRIDAAAHRIEVDLEFLDLSARARPGQRSGRRRPA